MIDDSRERIKSEVALEYREKREVRILRTRMVSSSLTEFSTERMHLATRGRAVGGTVASSTGSGCSSGWGDFRKEASSNTHTQDERMGGSIQLDFRCNMPMSGSAGRQLGAAESKGDSACTRIGERQGRQLGAAVPSSSEPLAIGRGETTPPMPTAPGGPLALVPPRRAFTRTARAAAAAAAADVHVCSGAEVANAGCYYLPIPEEEAAPMLLPEPTTNDYRSYPRDPREEREPPPPLIDRWYSLDGLGSLCLHFLATSRRWYREYSRAIYR